MAVFIEDVIVKIKVIDRDGQSHDLEAPSDIGLNLMELCKAAELPVKGTCGGMALCASCHCYVESNHAVGSPSEDEEDMLDQAFFVEDNSRLSCQLKVSEELNGMVLRLAPEDDG